MTTPLTSTIKGAAIALGLSLLCACSSNKGAAEPANVKVSIERGTSEGTPTMVKTTVTSEKVRVKDINYDSRTITLQDADGNEQMFEAGPEVVNFSQIKANDLVNAKYTEKLAVSVSKNPDEPDAMVVGKVEMADPGEKPGMVVTRTSQLTATVAAIDHDTRMVSLTGPEGRTVTFQVAPQAKGLENVNVGDQVVCRYTEAVEIWVSGS
jgi:hypothetical protein